MEQIDFNFLNEQKIKDIVERDYKELQELASKNTTKSIIVMSGGILEALLIDALVFSKEIDFEEACKGERKNGKKLHLFNLINLAKDKKIIREDVLSNAIRNYRNLVHAGKEIRENIHFDSADSDLALSAIKIFSRDLKKWYERERYLQEIEKHILNTSQEEKDFLLVFGSPSPTQPNQPEHPQLKNLNDANNLVKKKILFVDYQTIKSEIDSREYQSEIYMVNDDAKPFVESHIIGGNCQRDSIKIRQ